ncbi:MAG: ABC transporter permease, partial [Bdellovibrionales bacterium]|nr:ABC transporter permease [Bdellovibrionales bacterium]
MAYEPFVAYRYLRSKRKEKFISLISVIAVLGVGISVMVLNIVLAVMTGFEVELRNKLLGTTAHVLVRRLGAEMEEWQEIAGRVREVPNVTAVYPYTYNQAMLSVSGAARGVLIRGLSHDPVDQERLAKYLDDGVSVEDVFHPASLDVVRPDGERDVVELPPLIVGKALAQKLGITRGTPVTVYSPQLHSSPQGLIPRQRRFVVVGVYSSGLVEYEEGLAYTSIEASQSFFGLGSTVTGLEVLVRDLFQAGTIADEIVKRLENLPGAYYATDWTVPHKPLWEAIKVEKRVYFIVLLLLILLASFSIVSMLVMVVMEKTKDIAVLKSVGAANRFIVRVFLLQGIMIG